jgi:DNA-binding response OmpR family regulator
MNKILVIEDEKNIRETIQEILELNNFKVSAAENGLIGVAKALQFKPDLIICDVMMPEMDGFETLRNIRLISEIKNIPFVFLTAKTERRDFREGMNLGADDFLNKPFNTQELLKVIDLRIKKSRLEKQHYSEEISSLKKEIEKLQNSINDLSYNNSHVLRAPLLNILGLINFLIEESEEKSNLNNDVLQMLKESCLKLSEATEGVEKLLNNN